MRPGNVPLQQALGEALAAVGSHYLIRAQGSVISRSCISERQFLSDYGAFLHTLGYSVALPWLQEFTGSPLVSAIQHVGDRDEMAFWR